MESSFDFHQTLPSAKTFDLRQQAGRRLGNSEFVQLVQGRWRGVAQGWPLGKVQDAFDFLRGVLSSLYLEVLFAAAEYFSFGIPCRTGRRSACQPNATIQVPPFLLTPPSNSSATSPEVLPQLTSNYVPSCWPISGRERGAVFR